MFEWLSRQPDWQRDLARRVVASVELDDIEYGDALRMIKSTFGIPVDGQAADLRPIERADISPVSDAPVSRLLALGSLRGVGLISDTEEVTFGPTGLTLIYGQNAVGKSTYVRGLKALCRTVDRDCRILGNVYQRDATGTPPSARIKIDTHGAVLERRTRLDHAADVRLPGVSVFDAACAEFYVNAQNVVQYIPGEMRLLARLATLQDRMRRDLVRERQSLQEAEPSRDAYPVTTEVGRALASLRGRASDPDLNCLAVLTPQQHARIVEVRGVIAAAAAPTRRDDALAARREAEEARALVSGLVALSERTGSVAAERLRQAATNDAQAQEATRLAAEEFRGPVPGLAGGPWRVMWDAARSFVEGNGGTFPPSTGGYCPLCLQQVTADTAERMAHFHAHVSSTIQARADSTSKALASAMAECSPDHVHECRTELLVALRDREPDMVRRVETLLDAVAEHLVRMQASPGTAVGAIFDVEDVTRQLTAWAEGRLKHASTLLAAEDPEKRSATEAELGELEARQRLAGDLDVFMAWRTRLRVIAALSDAHSALATNRITSAQRELTESGIGKALGAALADELIRLSCTHLPVELSTSTEVAETRAGLRLLAQQPAGLSEIVSEGERRVLALCFFLAELSVGSSADGIVVDDPVSSLDDERRDYIADRLVAEAQHRQVIVFTHDLPFVFNLRCQAKKASVPLYFQHMWRIGDDVGRVDGHPPFKTMNLRERIGKLEQELQQAKEEPPPREYEHAMRRANGFYHRIRTSWERAVEERLFAGVVERFERDVKTLQLKDVKITDDLIRQVEQGMTRSSKFLHEDAFAAQVALPSLAEMSQDLEALREFERATRRSNS